jgi:hypothetical protein
MTMSLRHLPHEDVRRSATGNGSRSARPVGRQRGRVEVALPVCLVAAIIDGPSDQNKHRMTGRVAVARASSP